MNYKRTIDAVGNFAPPGHFYSPHPLLDDVETRYARVCKRQKEPGGLDLSIDRQVALLDKSSRSELIGPWHADKTDGLRYYYENVFLRFGDANAIWHMAGNCRPGRIIEIGCGFSTGCWLDSLDCLGLKTSVTCIEPYPDRLIELCEPDLSRGRISLLESGVQDVDPGVFTELTAGDVLFIDSTHVSKFGSDVNYLIFAVIPLLKSGVFIHFHDIFWPFEYPRAWFDEGRAWNEAYLVRAFLQYNHSFRTVRFNSLLAQAAPDVLGRHDQRFIADAGGSLWLEKL